MEIATESALAQLTDEGLFERLASAVLRLESTYAPLTHPGVNVDGKTVKAPLDGIAIVNRGELLLAVHHTITAANGLRRKWLLDPATIQPSKKEKSWKPPPPGDVIKTLEIIREERVRAPSLEATLILTTNQEIDQQLYRDVIAAGRAENVTIDIWTRTRISQSLDLSSAGQVIRRKLLGIQEELISRELLSEIGQESVLRFHAGDRASARVERPVDDKLSGVSQPLTIIAGTSGVGKTVAVHKAVSAQIERGRVALVIQHEAIEQATTLDQAIMNVLAQYRPTLNPGGSPLALFSEEDPLLLMIEDVSRSNRPQRLIGKLVDWVAPDAKGNVPASHVLCPIWPHLLAGLPSKVRDRLEPMILRLDVMSRDEGARAVTTHAAADGIQLQPGHADRIATALGHDPLLIGLNREWVDPRPAGVIASFVDDALQRVEVADGTFASMLRLALLALASEMLRHRNLDPRMEEIAGWSLSREEQEAIRSLCRSADLVRTEGSATEQRLRFRHDRVRDWVLAEAAVAMDDRGELETAVFGEPMLAEIMGATIVRTDADPALLERAIAEAPLALFEARRLAPADCDLTARVSNAALIWVSKEENRTDATVSLRWRALAALEGLVGKDIVGLVTAFPDDWYAQLKARLYNGDLGGGIALCRSIDLMIAADWTRHATEVLYERNAAAVRRTMKSIIGKALGSEGDWVDGIVRFAGVLGDPALASPLLKLWDRDSAREERLQSYLWAFARCATPATAATLLDPICALWAALPDTTEEEFGTPPRIGLVGHTLKFAFERLVPEGALDYFIARAEREDLSWPIEIMLDAVDHPQVVLFEARRAADRLRQSGEAYAIRHSVRDHWARANRDGRPMSQASRNALFEIWTNEESANEDRMSAFDAWSATHRVDDLIPLRQYQANEALAHRILRARLERGDRSAVPLLISKLTGTNPAFWWQFTRQVWSTELQEALDQALERVAANDEDSFLPWIVTRNLIHLPVPVAEGLLLKHWERVKTAGEFITAALYIATPALLDLAREVIDSAHEPETLLKHLGMNWGIRITGEAGVTRMAQIEGIAPYLPLLEPSNVEELAAACNKNGWFEMRIRLIDPHRESDKVETTERFRDRLDANLSQRSRFIDHDVDWLLQAGVAWRDLAETTRDWLSKQSSETALQIAAQAIGHAGVRADVALLSAWAGADASRLKDTIRDTDFVVARRSRI